MHIENYAFVFFFTISPFDYLKHSVSDHRSRMMQPIARLRF